MGPTEDLRAGRLRGWRVRFAGAMLCLLVGSASMAPSVVVASVAAAQPAAASVPVEYTLVARARVVTADKLTWQLRLDYVQSAALLEVSLVRDVSSPSGIETHLWQVPAPARVFGYLGSGAARLDLGNSGGSLLHVDLAFTPASHAAASCGVGAGTTYTGTLSGTFALATGLSAGGTVGGSSLHFTSGTPQLTAGRGCGPAAHRLTPCLRDAEASASPASRTASYLGVVGSFSGKSAVVVVTRDVSLKSPAKASRADIAEVTAAPVPKYSSSTRTLAVSLGSSGLITGSGSWIHGSQHSATTNCYSGRKTYRLRALTDSDSTYRANSKHPLTANTALTGRLRPPAEVKGSFYAVITAVSGG